MKIDILELSGSAAERGRIYGTSAGEKINRVLINYRRWFEEYCKTTWESAKREALFFKESVANYAPELLEEMEGIARGAEVTFDEIMLLNSRTEVAFRFLPECTSIGIPGKDGKPEGALVAQNWDWLVPNGESTVALNIRQTGKPSLFTITEAGMVGKYGVNSNGLALCVNLLGGSESKIGIPFHILARSVLNSSTMSEALQKATTTTRAFCGYFLIGDASGEVLGLEFSPKAFEIIGPKKGYILHTNHFLASHLTECDREKRDYPDTVVRYWRAVNLLKSGLDLGAVKTVLSDHANYPDSICRHQNPVDQEAAKSKTLVSFFVLLDQKKIFYSEGNPCESKYKELSFTDIFR